MIVDEQNYRGKREKDNELLKNFRNGNDLIYYDRQLKIYIPETLRAGSRIFDAMLSAVSTQNSKIYVAFYRRPLFETLEQFAQQVIVHHPDQPFESQTLPQSILGELVRCSVIRQPLILPSSLLLRFDAEYYSAV